MPKPIVGQPVYPSTFPVESPGTEVKEAWFLLEGFTGLTRQTPQQFLPRTVVTEAINVGYSAHGRLETQANEFFTSGTLPNSESAIAVYPHHTRTDTRTIVVTPTGVYITIISATTFGSFQQLSGPVLDLPVDMPASFVSWTDDIVLFSCRYDYIIVINLATASYSRLTSGPFGAGNITLMNGRVLASDFDLTQRRVQWSAKFNYADWAGLGAGFEDLLANQAGGVNPVFGVYAVSDTQGIVIRQNSFDVVQSTDNFDAPFRFQTRHPHKITYYPRSVARTGNSVMLASASNIYEVTLDAVRELGLPIQILMDQSATPNRVIGYYNAWRDTYSVSGFTGINAIKLIFTYSRRFNGWYAVMPPGNIEPQTMTYIGGLGTKAYNQLVGTYAAQTGTLDTWGGITTRNVQAVFITNGNNAGVQVVNESLARGFRFQLPVLEPSKPNHNITVLSVHVGYEHTQGSAGLYPCKVEYYDNGVQVYDTFTTANLTGNFIFESGVANMYKQVTKRSFIFRVSSALAPPDLTNQASLVFLYVLVRYTENQMEVSSS